MPPPLRHPSCVFALLQHYLTHLALHVTCSIFMLRFSPTSHPFSLIVDTPFLVPMELLLHQHLLYLDILSMVDEIFRFDCPQTSTFYSPFSYCSHGCPSIAPITVNHTQLFVRFNVIKQQLITYAFSFLVRLKKFLLIFIIIFLYRAIDSAQTGHIT
jgi:hypothetical protein